MATYTKGFVITPNKDVFAITNLVCESIKEFQKGELNKFPKTSPDSEDSKGAGMYKGALAIDFDAIRSEDQFTALNVVQGWPTASLRPESKSVSFDFVVYQFNEDSTDQLHCETRSLTLFFETDSDRLEYGEKSLNFMMGDYGVAFDLMPKIIEAVASHVQGAGYYIESDSSDDVDPALIFDPNAHLSPAP